MFEKNADLVATLQALAERYYAPDDGNPKGPTYLRAYADLLAERRLEPLRVLELGISGGASLLIWRDFLPNATIVGIDSGELPARALGQHRIHALRGSQDDPMVLDRAATLAGGAFDLIIDDASHVGYLTKRSLLYLFPRWLAPGGCYVIEDFGTGFLPEYPDSVPYQAMPWDDAVAGSTVFRSSQNGMVGVIKQLIEPMMQQLMTGTLPFLPIQRLTIESNIAFIEKRFEPGPVPPFLPAVNARPPADARPRARGYKEQIRQMELQMPALRRLLRPAERLWRKANRR